MPTGKIKWFNRKIGAGFIRSDEGENIFFRYDAVQNRDPQAIREGQHVSFDIAKKIRSLTQTASSVIPADFHS